jgi:hypothetical protein
MGEGLSGSDSTGPARRGAFDWRDLLYRRGISDDSIERFGLWFDGQKIHIPIPGAPDRLYDPRPRSFAGPDGKERERPKIRWARSLDGAALPPFPSLQAMADAEVLCEGELDCILLIQHGISAATGTAGAFGFQDHWAQAAASGRQPKILLGDADVAGVVGMSGGRHPHTGAAVVGVAERIVRAGGQPPLIALWPPGSPDGFDVTDWFNTKGVDDFRRDVLDRAVPWQPGTAPPARPPQRGVERQEPRKGPRESGTVRALYGPSADLGFTTVPHAAQRYRRRMGISLAELDLIIGVLNHYRAPREWVSLAQTHLAKELGCGRYAVVSRLGGLRRRGLVAQRPDIEHRRNNLEPLFLCLDPYLCVLASRVGADLNDERRVEIDLDAEERFESFFTAVLDEQWEWGVGRLSTARGDDPDVVRGKFEELYGVRLLAQHDKPLSGSG